MSSDMDQMEKPRRRRVLMQRKVTESEYETHKARMESLGLDPSDPAPSPATLLTAEREQASPVRAQSQRQVSLQRRTLEEQILAGRHERALARFDEQQEKWEAFRQIAARRTGRPKEDLVVTRAEEHRERLEVMELLDRATPEDVKSGGHSWYHSLRGEGTRYVQIGNMFSGLHLPIKLHKEEYIHEIVRKPLLTELITSRGLNNTKRKKRTWRDDEYLQARIRRYRKKMEELMPGKLEMHEMLEPEAVRIGVMTSQASTLLDTICEDDEPCEGHDEVSVGGTAGQASLADAMPPQGAALQTGPHIEVRPDRLQFQANTGKLCTQCIQLKNVGTAAVGYEWILNDAQHGFQESTLPDDPICRFMCCQAKGRVLPGEEARALFTFASTTPGVFTSTWHLKTFPDLLVPLAEVQMHGVATAGDPLLERRHAFHSSMFQQQVLHQVEELIEDIVASVRLRQPPLPELALRPIQQRVFEEVNASQGLHYTPHVWQRFTDLGSTARSLKELHSAEAPTVRSTAPMKKNLMLRGRRPIEKVCAPSAPLPTFPLDRGAPSAQQLAGDLSKLPPGDGAAARAQLQLELSREVRAAAKQPLEHSPLWWLAMENVTELALSVPEAWAAVRSAADLKPLPFLPALDDDALPDAVAEHSAQLERRTKMLGDADKEVEVRNTFIEVFGQERFGPAVTQFAMGAREIQAVGRVQQAATTSLRERLQPYLERQSIDSVELGGSVVVYEAELGFLAVGRGAEASDALRMALEGEEGERTRQRLRGVSAVLESGPRAVLVTAHVGEPTPLSPQDSGRLEPRGLASLEPLLELLREVCQDAAALVEFVPHTAWLEDAEAFAERVRSDEERKVFLLENMSALPEELGIRRTTRGAQETEPQGTVEVVAELLPWARREAWVARALGGDLRPDFFVQDSFTAACRSITSHQGLWLAAPHRVVGPFIEAELGSFVDALQLPFRTTEDDAADEKASAEAAAASGGDTDHAESEPSRVPAPLLVVLGGGGFGCPFSDEKLLHKLEVLMGLAKLVHHEKDGVVLALGGELAVCVLRSVFGIRLGAVGTVSAAMASAMSEALLEVLSVGVQVLLPTDFACEETGPAEAEASAAPGPRWRTLSLASAFPALAHTPVRLGVRDGRERFIHVDLERGAILLCTADEIPAVAAAAGASAAADVGLTAASVGEAAATEAALPEAAMPEGLLVRDVGEGTVQALARALRRSRGVVWNGVLGCWDHELWQRSTRAFVASIESRLAGGEEEEEEEEEDEEADAPTKASKQEHEPEVDLEVAVVIGRDSTRVLPSLMETPSLVTFVSESGDGLLQVLRGEPIPGLLACERS